MRVSLSRTVPILSLLVALVPLTTFGAFTQVTTFAGGGGAFSQPTGIAITPAGDLIVADRDHHQIKRVSQTGAVTIIAGTGALGDLDGAANVAQFKSPVAVAYDAPRDLIYVADTQSDSIRKIDGNGNVSTFAANGFTDPSGVAVDSSGNVYVADTGNNKIKKITPAGVVTTIAGAGQAAYLDGAALSAKFRNPYGLAITAGGVLYIADQKNHVIRKLDNGTVSTVAGTGTNGLVDGPALSAKFTEPKGIAFDASGNLIVADSNNEVIRQVTLGASPTVSTIAGTGALGLINGPPLSAKFREPSGIAFAGSIYVADAGNDVIRAISPNATPTALTIFPAGATLNPGGAILLSARASFNDGTTADVSTTAVWSSSNGASATVTSVGLVSAGATGDTIITATLGGLNATAIIHVVAAESLPPDPATVATPIDPAVVTILFDSTSFLYSGSNPIQRGVTVGTIDLVRASVVRGAVTVRGGQPLSGVTITVAGHPEYGHTISRSDGRFDLAVNGGGVLTIQYRKDGYIALDRQVTPRWNSWTVAETAILIPYDTATVINFGAPGMKVVRGSASTDSDGTRRATLLFASGTAATMTLTDGSTRPLPTATIRATEFTVGNDGQLAMPASLPPSSGYTYCVELSADEAVAAGATRVDFSQAVSFYIENFISVPVGHNVPVGFYDRTSAQWVPMENGRVVQIVAIQAGRAYLDIDGDGAADDSDALIGTTIEERNQLATLYSAGQTLWRIQTSHFTPLDGNYPYGAPAGSKAPKNKKAETGKDLKNCSKDCGSIIGVENQTLGEQIAVQGTPFALYYDSSRVPGRQDNSSVNIPITDSDPPTTTIDIALHLIIAGQPFEQHFSAAPNQTYRFTWDGLDAYGRKVQGVHDLIVQIDYEYALAFYLTEAAATQSFARFSGAPFSIGMGAAGWRPKTIKFTQQYTVPLKAPEDWPAKGIGGWTLNVHHVYDPTDHVLEPGTGGKRNAQGIGSIARIIVGKDPSTCQRTVATSAPARDVCLTNPQAVAVAADGTLYISDSSVLYRVTTSGTLFPMPVSGPGSTDMAVQDIAVAPGGSLYLSEPSRFRVQRLQNGVLTRIAGNGQNPDDGSHTFGPGLYSGPATTVAIRPLGISFDRSGNVLIATGDRVYEVRTSGFMQTVAGSGDRGHEGDDGPALSASLVGPSGVFEEESGNLVVTSPDATNVREIGTDGVMHTIASGSDSSFGSGGPSDFAAPVAPVPGGSLLAITNQDVVLVDQNGARGPIAQHGSIDKDLAPALKTAYGSFRDVAMAPDGAIYVAEMYFGNDGETGRIRRIEPLMPGLKAGDTVIPSEDGSEWYVFNAAGRHLRTLDGLLQTTRYEFGYDDNDGLITITDVDGNITTVERDGGGRPTAIVASGGQRSTLAVGGDGYLSSLTNVAGESHHLGYRAGGLLTSLINPRGKTYTFTYDATGRLTRDTDPAGGFISLLQSGIDPNDYVVTKQRAEGPTSQYHVQVNNDTVTRTITDEAGVVSTIVTNADGSSSSANVLATSDSALAPDPRFGMLAPIPANAQWRTGSIFYSQSMARSLLLADPHNPLSPALQDAWSITTNGRTYTTTYSGATRTFTMFSPQGRTVTTAQDTRGRLTSRSIPGLTPVQYQYDARGHLSSVLLGNRPTSLTWDPSNRLAAVTDTLNRTISFEYDAADRTTTQVLPDGRQIHFTYDQNGNLTAVTPPSRPQHILAYTTTDLRSAYTPPAIPNGGATQYAYNLDKQLTQVTRPDSRTVALGYDGAGRIATLTIGRGTYQYSHDAASGNLSSIIAPDGGLSEFTYDGSLLNDATWTGAVTGSIHWDYDSDFGVRSETVNCPNIATLACNTVGFTYDEDRLLIGAGDLTLARDAQNGLLTGTSIASVADAWTYNLFGEPLSYTATFGEAEVFKQQYVRDDVGRIAMKSEIVDSVTSQYGYGYDAAGRLTDVTKDGVNIGHYAYDENGNRLVRTTPAGTEAGSYDVQDRLVGYNGSTSYTYTAAGELLTRSDPTGTTTFTYDELGNLNHVTLPGGTAIDYLIDGSNRRIGKKVNGTVVQRFVYSGAPGPAAELNENGDVIARFIYATRPNVPDVIIKGNATYRVVADHLGSPRVIIKVDDGTIVQRLDFDEFGNVLSDTNPGFQPFGFAGGLYDAETGMVRSGARDYDPQTGRFTTKDPKLFGGGDTNLYGYVMNDPINLIDPMGTDWLDTASNALAGFGDTVSFGASRWAREKISHAAFGQGSGVDQCSLSYRLGQVGGVVWWTAFGGAVGDEIAGANFAEKELGNLTLETAEYEARLENLSEGEKLAELGGTRGALGQAFRNVVNPRWWPTIVRTTGETGPTPGGWGGLPGAAVGTGGAAAARAGGCGCQ